MSVRRHKSSEMGKVLSANQRKNDRECNKSEHEAFHALQRISAEALLQPQDSIREAFSLDRSTQGSHLSSFYHRAHISILSLLDQPHRHCRKQDRHRDNKRVLEGSKEAGKLPDLSASVCLSVRTKKSLLKSK